VGSLKLLVCPRRNYGDNVFALNETSALLFTRWEKGISSGETVSEFSTTYRLPDDFQSQAERCMSLFERLASGGESEGGTFSGGTELPDLGADKSFWDSRVPVYGGIEPTWRCNLNCCHCYIRDPGKQELGIDAWRTILDQLAQAGCLHLAITGGEPLRYRHFLELYQYAALSGFIITLFTNGTLITPDIAEVLAELPPRRVEISIYGATKETYEAVTGIPGSYSKFVRGLEILSRYRNRIDVILKAVILKESAEERREMRLFAARHGYPLAQISLIRPRLDGVVRPELHRLSPGEVATTELEVQSARDAWTSYLSKSTPISTSSGTVDCSAGNVAFQVDAAGRLGYCVIARAPGIDLQEVPMRIAWERLGDLRGKYFRKPAPCVSCTFAMYCDFCPGYSSLGPNGSGDQDAGDRAYHCAVARARKKVVDNSIRREEEERNESGTRVPGSSDRPA